MNWKHLESENDLAEAQKESHSREIVIFKHSTSCGISRMVLRNFENEIADLAIDHISFYFLDLKSFRSVSNAVSKVFGVIHESPQLLHIKEGTAIANSSHSNISASSLLA